MKFAAYILSIAATLTLMSPIVSAEGFGPILTDSKRILVNGNAHKKDFPCNGRTLVVEGSDHVITTTGVCAGLAVTGANNAVTAEVAPKGKLLVAGTLHKVKWKSTGEPEQDLSGIDNKVERMK